MFLSVFQSQNVLDGEDDCHIYKYIYNIYVFYFFSGWFYVNVAS